jgi:isopentenyldiphosphate isomerase
MIIGGGGIMCAEMIRIFDGRGEPIGVKPRDEVHEKGFWHETFHCWFVEKAEQKKFIYLQQRCHEKKDFPDLFDITAAGHIKADECVGQAIREIHEELGVPVRLEELSSLGVIRDEIALDHFVDREFCHVFLCTNHFRLEEFRLQKEEVSGLYKASYNEFITFAKGEKNTLHLSGFDESQGCRIELEKKIDRALCVPHSKGYLLQLAEKLSQMPLI